VREDFQEGLLKRVVSLMIIVTVLIACTPDRDWRTARRDPAGIAPDPATTSEAVLHVYGADAWGWRGWFAIHTWIAAKRSGEAAYTIYEVVGWRQQRGQPVVRIEQDLPDRYWYGERPRLLKEHRGQGVDRLIDAVDRAARAYPWPESYSAFPGPNSNTFTAWVVRQVPELGVDLPFSAIGSGYVN
jgi:GNAT superfamily N-acetyltransferase